MRRKIIRVMNFTFSFLADVNYWVLLGLGGLALLPRARFTADRMSALAPDELQRIKPASRSALAYSSPASASSLVS